MSWGINPSRPPVSTPSWNWRPWQRSRCHGEEARYDCRRVRHPPGGLPESARSPWLPDACRENAPSRVRRVCQRPRAPVVRSAPRRPGVGVPGLCAQRAERCRPTPEYRTGVSPLPPGRRPRHRSASARPAAHATPADNPSSSPPPRSRRCWRRRTRVVHGAPCARTPYRVCSGCWPAPVCGSAKRSAYRSIRSNWISIRRNYISWRRSSINHGIVPLHPSTAERLRHYQAQRAHLHYDGLSDAFFVSERGQPLQHRALHDWFARLCQRVAIAPTARRTRPMPDARFVIPSR